MKAFWEARRKALSWGLAALLVLWALWYARPLDIYDLIGGETLGYLQISIFPQSEFPKVIYGNLTLTAGKPEMEAVLERLEEIRFHRTPLEVVLRFLPQGPGSRRWTRKRTTGFNFSPTAKRDGFSGA